MKLDKQISDTVDLILLSTIEYNKTNKLCVNYADLASTIIIKGP